MLPMNATIFETLIILVGYVRMNVSEDEMNVSEDEMDLSE